MPKHSKAKQYRYESESEDEDLEGGFLGSFFSAAARLGSKLAPKVAKTAARTGTKVIGRTPAVTSRVLSSPLRATTRVTKRFGMPALNVLGTAAAVGLPIYQGIDYERQKAINAEETQRIANQIALEQSNAYFSAQDVETQKYLDEIEEQRAAYEREARELEAMRLKEQADYDRMMAEQEAIAARDAEAYERAMEQQQQMMEDQQRYIEEQIRAEIARLSRMYSAPPARQATTPAPSRPATTPAPSRPATTPAPAPTEAPQRLQRRGTVRGQGVKVDKRKVRAEIVKRVMREKGFKKLSEASKYVKDHNLYKGQ